LQRGLKVNQQIATGNEIHIVKRWILNEIVGGKDQFFANISINLKKATGILKIFF